MTDRVDINRVLVQMRTLKAQAQNRQTNELQRPLDLPGGMEVGKVRSSQEVPNFNDMLGQAVNKVNETQKQSSVLAKAFEMGDPNVSITQVMVASQKASVSFEAMTQVRNKLIEAYEKVMSMPV
jgi:flagellar hook-basal body complex protein FliE